MNATATLVITNENQPVINLDESIIFETPVDPLPRGEIATAFNPEGDEIVLSYRYTEDHEGAVYYFITHEGCFVKAFSHIGMALAVHNALSKTTKKEHKHLIPNICRTFVSFLGDQQDPTETELDEVLGLALLNRRYGK
jgi:hypothetical protein